MTRGGWGVWAVRIVLALLGLAALAWGLTLTTRFMTGSFAQDRSALSFLIGAPVLHDALVAPIVAVTGLVISRWVGPAWRTPVRIGAAISAVLTLIAVPTLWRPYAGLPNPGLDDRNYRAGLLIALGVVWVLVLAFGLLNRRFHRLGR